MTLADLVRGPSGGDDPGQASLPFLGSWSSNQDPKYKYSDIWDYAGFGAPNMQGVQGGDQPAIGQFAPGPGHAEGGQWVPEDKYRGIVSYNTSTMSGDDPRSTTSTSIDWSKLPALSLPKGWDQFNTQQGGGIMPFKGDNLRNPGLTYNDPNFGPMTPFANRKPRTSETVAKLVPLAIMAGLSGGFGSLVGPGLAAGLGNVVSPGAANSIFNFAGNSLLSGRIDPMAAAGAAGIDPRLISLAKLVNGMRP